MSLGCGSLAAPNPASSSVSRYWRIAPGASAGSMRDAPDSSFGVEFCLFASASMRLTSIAVRRPPSADHAFFDNLATDVWSNWRSSSLSRKRP